MPRLKKLRPGRRMTVCVGCVRRGCFLMGNGSLSLGMRSRVARVIHNVIKYWADRAVFLFKKAGEGPTRAAKADSSKSVVVPESQDTTSGTLESRKFDKWV